MKLCLMICGFILALFNRVNAKAHFQTKNEMIQKADVIAIVSIEVVNSTHKRGKFWTYQQGADARVETILKRKLPSHIMIYGKEDFECAQTSLKKGRFLVFLEKDRNLWVGSNWQLAFRSIQGNQVEWYNLKDDQNDRNLVELTKVIQEIERKIN